MRRPINPNSATEMLPPDTDNRNERSPHEHHPVELHQRLAELEAEIARRVQMENELHLQTKLLEAEIADRQRAEEAARTERDNVRALFEAAPVGMMLINATCRVIDANRAMQNICGKNITEMCGRVPGQVFECAYTTPDSKECGHAPECSSCRLREMVRGVIQSRKGRYGVDIQHIRRHGSQEEQLWLKLSVEPITISGQPCAIIAVDNVTEHRLLERQVHDERERLDVTLRSIGDGVITTDTAGNVVLLNAAAERMTGWSQHDAAGSPLSTVFRIISLTSRKPLANPLETVLTSGEITELAEHTVLVARNGAELQIADSAAPIRDASGAIVGMVLVFRDITEKHALENELLRTRKLESLGVLAGGIAHDFNNLLTGILGNLSLILNRSRQHQNIATPAERALQATERAADLTRQLLTFAKGGAPVRRLTSLEGVIRDSAEFAVRGTKVRCEFEISPDLWAAEVDVGQLSQVIGNLVINAEQAMPNGGRILVSAVNRVLTKQPGQTLPPGHYVAITVADQGIGIPEEHIERIFDPYFTTKEQGSGLGLSSVYSIVAKHGGSIKVVSDVGAGTSFTLLIPASDQRPRHEPRETPGLGCFAGSVLVMDDEPFIRDLAVDILDILGFEGVACDNGNDAVALYTAAFRNGTPFRAVVMDLTIPGGMGGCEAMQQILQIDPQARGIVVSGYSNDPVLADFRSYGFCGMVPKPFTLRNLAEALNHALA